MLGAGRALEGRMLGVVLVLGGVVALRKRKRRRMRFIELNIS
jgi:hypothetical protein